MAVQVEDRTIGRRELATHRVPYTNLYSAMDGLGKPSVNCWPVCLKLVVLGASLLGHVDLLCQDEIGIRTQARIVFTLLALRAFLVILVCAHTKTSTCPV